MFGTRRERRVCVEVEPAMDQERAGRVAKVSLCAGPNVLVCRQTLRLSDRLRVETGGLVPQSRLIVARPISPVQNAGGIWQ